MKAVVLDFYGTLAEASNAVTWIDLLAQEYGVPREVRARWWSDNLDGLEHDEHSQSRDHYIGWQNLRTHSMLDEAGVPRSMQDAAIARFRQITRDEGLDAYAEAADVLAELRERDLVLAICSNWDWDLLEAIERAGLSDRVDVTVSSAWVGARKPHPRIYARTLDELGVAPEETVFVGDTWTCDVAGPRAVGMHVVYLRRPHFGVDTTAPDDHHTEHDVHRARDLRAVLDLV